MRMHQLTAHVGRRGAVVTLTTVIVGLAAAPALGSTLWKQLRHVGSAASSQNFETANDDLDNEVADDVTVPSDANWRVKSVEVQGVYANGFGGPAGPADSVDVTFYSDILGTPGAPVYSAPGVFPSAGLATGDFAIDLPTAARLDAGGTYWLSVRANQNLGTNGQWFWQNRKIQIGNPAMYREPGNGFGTNCTDWSFRGSTCKINKAAPDQIFKLKGKVVPVVP